ncbi:hypothetical protein HOP52_13280 [Halomonas campisalis]|uniref:Uncharacterized protein n=1 Tax=Billgrantia campisalis TaxID=74661 RepID=A0ABS9PAD3_9GAMM|nr:DUF6489 family protein [Halomonas campisalis]MCG6658727.1 hypothetical protein [Halomonas campisalis]MDR5864008.1 DUF6489 family protein [Halomonas campisalis]
MKINVEFDLTPDEFRRALGLPDVEAFQQELLNRIQKQMESGVEGYDPMSLMQPFLQQQGMPQGLTQGLSQGLASFGTYQQMMLDMLRNAATSARSGDETTGQSDTEASSGEAGEDAKPKGKSRQGMASARSRSQRSE